MKLPIPLLLYLVSAGLFGLAGWTFYEMLPLWKDSVRQAATNTGQTEALDRIGRGRGQARVSADWQYTPTTAPWWGRFREVNLIGKLPPPPPEAVPNEPPPPPPPPPVRPLEEIIELVSVVYDGQDQGKGGNSHVIVRYRPEANVEPPEWYVRENLMPPAGAASATSPRDVAPLRPPAPGARPAGQAPAPAAPRPAGARPATSMPTSMVGREVLQKLWVKDEGDARRSARLWPGFSDIRLVRVAADAQSAFFVRVPPPPKAGDPAIEPKEEELLKTTMNLSQDVLRELRRLQGRSGETPVRDPSAPVQKPDGTWVDVPETSLVNGVRHVSRKDEQRFRENSDELFEQLNVDTYISKNSNLRGLVVRNVDPQLASKFGVSQGEVLLELNGRPVQSKAQAVQLGKADYKRGVRTFLTKWLANGQVVERTYQAPDK